MKLTAVMSVWMAMLGGPVADASDAPIFADDFNRAVSTSVGNGWSVLWVEWRDGANAEGAWTAIASHALAGPTGHSAVLQQVTGAGDIADFEFRFRVAVDSNNEGADRQRC
jgi:hypothetical protein